MASKYRKRHSTSLIIIEMQIGTTGYLFTPTKMAIIILKKQIKKTGVGDGNEKLKPSTDWWEWQMVQPFWKTAVSQKENTDLTYDPAIPFLEIEQKE